MGKIHTCAAVGLALLLAACDRHEETLAAQAPPSITAHVRVLDADVLIVDGRHVRLADAYAPESLLHARCWAESLASDHATEFARTLVEHARSYAFRPTGGTDDYGRAFGDLTIDGADLGDLLYAEGLAARPTTPRFDWCQPISQKAAGAPKISSLYTVDGRP
jgi:endonuclease YncB( thermonuclease family)